MNPSRWFVMTAFLPSIGGTMAGSLWAASSDWNALQDMKPGQQIRVVLNDLSPAEGAFQALNEEGITVREVSGEKTFARKNILRVYFRGKNHRVRNMFICAAIGAVLAVPAELAYHNNNWPNDGNWIWPVFVISGGGLGAAVPTGGWRLVYRARRQQ